jgi:hypothetical protein
VEGREVGSYYGGDEAAKVENSHPSASAPGQCNDSCPNRQRDCEEKPDDDSGSHVIAFVSGDVRDDA